MISILVAENNFPFTRTQFDLLSNYLPPSVTDSANKYKRWQDAQAFLLGRYLLSEGLKRCGFDRHLITQIDYTKYKRPFLPIPLDFNISHSGKYVLCALSLYKIGIDIEAVSSLTIDDFASCFSPEELSRITNAPDRYNEFFKYWTIKEAVIKADGKGLSIPLEMVVVSDNIIIGENSWFIHKIDIDTGYQSHLATNEPSVHSIPIERISLPET